nr:hypothetical protein CFP56_73511 [Quercus suber]
MTGLRFRIRKPKRESRIVSRSAPIVCFEFPPIMAQACDILTLRPGRRMKARLEELQAKVKSHEQQEKSTSNAKPIESPTINADGDVVRSPVAMSVDQNAAPSSTTLPWKIEHPSPQDRSGSQIGKDCHIDAKNVNYHEGRGEYVASHTSNSSGSMCLPPPTTPPTPYQPATFQDPVNVLVHQSQMELFDLLDNNDNHSPHTIPPAMPGYQHDSIGSVHDSAISFGLFDHAADRGAEPQDMNMLENFIFPAADSLDLSNGYAKQRNPYAMSQPAHPSTTSFAPSGYMASLDFCLPTGQSAMDMTDDAGSTLDHQNPPSLISTPRTPSPQAPLDERIDYVLASIKAAGFKDLNASVTAYYTHSFSDASPLQAHQRMSRNRRLPRLLAAMRASAENWSDWERRGTPYGAGAHYMQNARRAFEEDLPNLWALITTLSADNGAVSQRDRMQIAFVVVFTLCCGNRMSKDQLLSLIQQTLGVVAESPS